MKRIEKNQLIVALLLIISVLFVSSCATVSKENISTLFSEENLDGDMYDNEDHYLLGPDDVVHIVVENHPEWSGDFSIRPDGRVVIPALGNINAEGLFREEFEANLELYLDKYINNPRVTIDIVQYASQVVYILGEVASPGKYPTEGKKLTLRDAVIAAGLPTRNAAIRRVFIISASRKNPHREVVNLYRILYRGELKRNIELEPGDVVYIPKTLVGMIGDFVGSLLSPFSSVSAVRTAIAPEAQSPLTIVPAGQ